MSEAKMNSKNRKNDKNGTPKIPQAAPKKPAATKATAPKPTDSACTGIPIDRPTHGTQILLSAIREAGATGVTKAEVIAKCEKLLPNKNPKSMIARTLTYFMKKHWITSKGDRFLIASENK